MMWMLTTYWLEALLAGGFMLLLALPFVWLRGLIKIESDRNIALFNEIKAVEKRFVEHFGNFKECYRSDCKGFTQRLDLLDKPSNDRALENIAVILKKKISRKPIVRKPIATSKPRRKANGVSSHVR